MENPLQECTVNILTYYFRQANVSSVYRKVPETKPDKNQTRSMETGDVHSDNMPGPSHFLKDSKQFNSMQAIKEIKKPEELKVEAKPVENVLESTHSQDASMQAQKVESVNRVDQGEPVQNMDPSSNSSIETQHQLERRLMIEEEVTFVSS